ncbi:MAG: siderophore ABC transporter substrate-binding protein [Burkholderiaceae bacterium]|nr:siderophore ABC transporter substrate-binding protein [Burkholderiaceae bacterium]
MLKRLLSWPLALALALMLLFGQAAALAQDGKCGTKEACSGKITVPHARGVLTLEKAPQKVLVMDPSALDILMALDVPVAGVPGGNLPAYMTRYTDGRYLKIGTLFEPDYEAINAAQADLIIIGGRSAGKYDQLSRILPALDLTTDKEDPIGSIKANVLTLGKLFGRQARAQELNTALDARFEKVKALARDAGTALVLVTNAGKVGAYGPTSRVGWLHTVLGLKTVEAGIDDRFHGGDIVSFEYILQKNPDWMFVIDRDAGVGQSKGQAAQKVLDNALMHRTKVWKEKRIVYLNPSAAYVSFSGIQAINLLLDDVGAALGAAAAGAPAATAAAR